jgi:hypothetical protein
MHIRPITAFGVTFQLVAYIVFLMMIAPGVYQVVVHGRIPNVDKDLDKELPTNDEEPI